MWHLVYGVLCYLTRRIASLVDLAISTPFATVELWAWKNSKRVLFNEELYKHPSGYPMDSFCRLGLSNEEETSIYSGRSFQNSRNVVVKMR